MVHGNTANRPVLSGHQPSAAAKAGRLSTDAAFDYRMRQLASEGVKHAQEYVARQQPASLYCEICHSSDCDHIA